MFFRPKPITGLGSADRRRNRRVELFRSILRLRGLVQGSVDLVPMASQAQQAPVRVRVLPALRRPTRWSTPRLRLAPWMVIRVAALTPPLRRVRPFRHPMPGSSPSQAVGHRPRPRMAGLDPLAMGAEPAVLRIRPARSSAHPPRRRPPRSALRPDSPRVRRFFLSRKTVLSE